MYRTVNRPHWIPAASLLALALLAGCSGGHDEHAAHAPAASGAAPAQTAPAQAEAGIAVRDAWIRLPPAGAPVAGGYMTLHNGGPQDDRLLALRTSVADHVEIHEMRMEDEVMKMRELTDGLPLPVGQDVVLAPGGLHLMFMQPVADLQTLQQAEVTLVFEQAGERTVRFRIGADAGGDGHAHAAH